MTDRNQATILLEEHLKELGLRFEAEYQFCQGSQMARRLCDLRPRGWMRGSCRD